MFHKCSSLRMNGSLSQFPYLDLLCCPKIYAELVARVHFEVQNRVWLYDPEVVSVGTVQFVSQSAQETTVSSWHAIFAAVICYGAPAHRYS